MKHFQDLKVTYGNVLCFNLVNKKGYELLVGEAFTDQAGKLGDAAIKYVSNDLPSPPSWLSSPHPLRPSFFSSPHPSPISSSSVRYTHFDFHHECRKMQWHKIQNLLTQFEQEIRDEGLVHDLSLLSHVISFRLLSSHPVSCHYVSCDLIPSPVILCNPATIDTP